MAALRNYPGNATLSARPACDEIALSCAACVVGLVAELAFAAEFQPPALDFLYPGGMPRYILLTRKSRETGPPWKINCNWYSRALAADT
ncbi:hypothetical protein [Paraburkholderia bryophila]|uniref:Uncharacterized protein n=1 Tax=Paraburkholderia bryophila TaxID=420952 RepID=A0A329D722_9BURK|nr:hypothetical protein [Paraburkholderia bryophila]RAS38345.1 hypothetical protein BX591_102643 [Paraburkholderia bryophila]